MRSEFYVGAESWNDDRSAVAVVSGIVDVLNIGRQIDSSPDMERVVGFQDIFSAVVEMTVAEQETEASRGKIVLVILLDGVGNERQARAVLLAMPPGAVGADSLIEGLINFRIGEGFGAAVVPPEAGEGSEIARQVLLQIQAESVLARDVPGMIGDVGSCASVLGLDHLIAVDTHVRGIGVGENANYASLLRQDAAAEFVFEILGVYLPRFPDEIDAVGDLGHQGFGKTESPVAIFEIEYGTDCVTAGVGGVVPGAVIVDGPVEELEMRVGAGGIDVEKIRQAEFAESEFETAAGQFGE